MTENHVNVSDDRMEMVISGEAGHTATMRSARREGFTDQDVANARCYPLRPNMVDGQVNRARRFQLGNRVVYVHVNTGPPSWWLPRVRVKRREVMFGWLRGLVAFSFGKAT